MDSVLVEREPATRLGRRRRRLRRKRAGVLMVALALVGFGIGVTAVATRRPSAPPGAVAGASADGPQLTTLVAMTLSSDASRQADSLTLFAMDRTGGKPVVLFVPVGTFGQIPGQGFEAIGKALTFGRPTLQQTTVENVLGIVIDRTVIFDDVSAGRVIDALGGIDVEVTERLLEPDERGRKVPVFTLGRQHMDAAAAITYATYRGEDETELQRFGRAQKVWEGMFAAAGPGGRLLRDAVTRIEAPATDREDVVAFADLLARIAAAPGRERSFQILPVVSVGAGGPGETYRVDDGPLGSLIAREFAGSLPSPGLAVNERPRVEIRNGNGRPELGEQVASILVPAGMKIEVTGNARSFDFPSTRIVVYGDDEASLSLGRRVRELLGIGEVEIGRRGQTVVDVTIVVGKDFSKRRG